MQAAGAVTLAGDIAKGAGGASLFGMGVDGPGGDLRVIRVDLHDDPGRGRRGMITRTTLVDSDVVFFCEDAGTGETHPPILAWFQPCRQDARWGFGGTIGTFQYDGGTGRSAVRPLEVDLVMNALGNGFGEGYHSRRLLPYAGLSLESVWPGTAPGTTTHADSSLRLSLGSMGMLRSSNDRWELRGLAGVRQDLTEWDDLAFEAGIKLFYHFLVWDEGNRGARDAWAFWTAGLESGYSYWGKPRNSIAGRTGPFVSDRDFGSWQFLLTLEMSPTALHF